MAIKKTNEDGLLSSYKDALLRSVLQYLDLGYHVFPMISSLGEDGAPRKIPLTPHGFHDATNRREQIELWFRDRHMSPEKGLMYGIATGAPSRILVVDCDCKHEGENGIDVFGDVCRRHGESPSGCHVTSPSGGKHYYYRLPPEYCDGSLPSLTAKWPGVDIRADGGCIMAAGSRDIKGRYYVLDRGSLPFADAPFLPAWLYREIARLPQAGSAAAGEQTVSSSVTEPAEAKDAEELFPSGFLNGLRDMLLSAETGTRNRQLYVVALNSFRYTPPARQAAYNVLMSSLSGIGRDMGLMPSEVIATLNSAGKRALNDGPFTASDPMPGWLSALVGQGTDIPALLEEEPVSVSPLREGMGDLLVFPPPPLNFWPERLREIVERVSAAKCVPPEMVMVNLLGLGTSCTGYSRMIELRPDWMEPALLWLLLVAGSGSGKSHTQSYIYKYLRKHETAIKVKYREERARYEREYDKWKRRRKDNDEEEKEPPREPVNIQYTVEDITMEAVGELLRWNASRGLSLVKDEAWKIFDNVDRYNPRGSSKARLLNMWDAIYWQSSRKTQDGQSRELYLPRAPLSFFGMLQTSVLPEFFSADDLKLGFTQRFLIVCSQAREAARFDAPAVPEEIDALLARITHNMLEFRMLPKNPATGLHDPVIIHLSDTARNIFRDYVDRTNIEMLSCEEEEGTWRSKAIRNLARIALVLYCLDQASRDLPAEDDLLSGEIMTAAVRTMTWIDAHRKILSPFTSLNFRHAPRPVDKIVAAAITRHADDIRKLDYCVSMKQLLIWCREDAGNIQLDLKTLGHSASRLSLVSVHTRQGNARLFDEKAFERCRKFHFLVSGKRG